ncbi:DNA-methyltransferase [Acidovorax sp.]|uniref:DNA-methyltransferase n=1 Tax=Acidovorax sp. TaxID=1872122 RepID=UPI0040384F62
MEKLVNTTFAGDAYDLLGLLPNNTIDLIITSPPYWGHRDYDLDHNWDFFNNISNVKKIGPSSPGYVWYRSKGGILGLEPYPEWYITHLAEFFCKASHCLKSTGSLWINLGDTYFARWSSIRNGGRQGLGDQSRKRRKTPMGGFRAEKQLLLIPSRFALEMKNRKWILRNDVIWHKPNVLPLREGDRLNLAHEHFFHFVKKPKVGRPRYYYDHNWVENRQSDVVSVRVEPGDNGHTATFPKSLIKPRILSCTPVGGVVLDPFCGTGRALEVAVENERGAIGFDLQTKFAAVAFERLRK